MEDAITFSVFGDLFVVRVKGNFRLELTTNVERQEAGKERGDCKKHKHTNMCATKYNVVELVTVAIAVVIVIVVDSIP